MPEPAAPLTLPELREALARDLPVAFEGLEYFNEGEVYYVTFPATRSDGTVDKYLTKWTFLDYPGQPPHVTFVDPETRRYDPAAWPEGSSPRTQLTAVYGDAPEGLICNSMFYGWYHWGGHGDQPAVSWIPGVHKTIATVTELKDVLRAPHYKGPRS